MEEAKKGDEAVESASPAIIEEAQAAQKSYFWFVAENDVMRGPYSTHDLAKRVRSREINERAFLWRDGYREWRPLYGIEELGSAASSTISYPKIPVPGKEGHVVSLAPQGKEKRAVYAIKFQSSRWNSLSKGELIGFFLISILSTVAILNVAIKIFEREWDQIWGRRSSEMLLSVGLAPEALPVYVYDPLLSAPGLAHQNEHWVAVDMEGNIPRQSKDHFEGRIIESPLPAEVLDRLSWDKSHTYTKRLRLQGYIDLKNPQSIAIESRGLPFEPRNSLRLSERSLHP